MPKVERGSFSPQIVEAFASTIWQDDPERILKVERVRGENISTFDIFVLLSANTGTFVRVCFFQESEDLYDEDTIVLTTSLARVSIGEMEKEINIDETCFQFEMELCDRWRKKYPRSLYLFNVVRAEQDQDNECSLEVLLEQNITQKDLTRADLKTHLNGFVGQITTASNFLREESPTIELWVASRN